MKVLHLCETITVRVQSKLIIVWHLHRLIYSLQNTENLLFIDCSQRFQLHNCYISPIDSTLKFSHTRGITTTRRWLEVQGKKRWANNR